MAKSTKPANKARKSRLLSEAHKTKIGASVKRAHAARRKAAKLTVSKGAAKSPAPAKISSAASRKRGLKMPQGISILRRHGNGKDIIECNADEVRDAVKFFREMKKRVK